MSGCSCSKRSSTRSPKRWSSRRPTPPDGRGGSSTSTMRSARRIARTHRSTPCRDSFRSRTRPADCCSRESCSFSRKSPTSPTAPSHKRRDSAHAIDPLALLGEAGIDPARVEAHFEPYQGLDTQFVLKRLQAALNPPPGVTLSVDGGRSAAQESGGCLVGHSRTPASSASNVGRCSAKLGPVARRMNMACFPPSTTTTVSVPSAFGPGASSTTRTSRSLWTCSPGW